MSVIKAEFVDTKRIPSRQMYKIVCEVPIEHQAHVHSVLGWPYDDGSAQVLIVKLDSDGNVPKHMANCKLSELMPLPPFLQSLRDPE